MDEDNVINEGGLRNDREFVNYKILDLAGDFLLSGYRILGKVICHQGGHELSNMFLNKLMNSKLAFKNVELDNNETVISKKENFDQSVKLVANA